MEKGDIKRLPDAELSVMQIIWGAAEPVSSAYVQTRTAQDWKTTSVLTFLARLTEKGFLKCEKQGKCNVYTPLVAREDYLKSEGASLLDRLYAGSVKELVASLADAGRLSGADVQELRAFLEAQGGGGGHA